MYVYNIIEAQNKSAQKNANLICNMQIVLKKYLQVYIPLNVLFRQIKSFRRFRLAFVFGLQPFNR